MGTHRLEEVRADERGLPLQFDFAPSEYADLALFAASRRGLVLRYQIMRKSSRVRKSSTVLMYFDAVPIKGASPPVARTLVSFPISGNNCSRIPSTSPRYP